MGTDGDITRTWFSTTTDGDEMSIVDSTKVTISPPKRGTTSFSTTDNVIDDEEDASSFSNTVASDDDGSDKSKPKKRQKNKKKNTTSSTTKRNYIKRTRIRLLHLHEELHSTSAVEDAFDRAAKRNEPFKYKWIRSLEKQLSSLNEKLSDNPNDENSASSTTPLLQRAQQILKRKGAVSKKCVQTAFWDLILVESQKEKRKKQLKLEQDLPDSYWNDVQIFQDAREWCVEYPFFWSVNRKRSLRDQHGRPLYLKKRVDLLKKIHSETISSHETEAHDLVRHLYQNLNAKSYQDLVCCFRDYIKACEMAYAAKLAEGQENLPDLPSEELAAAEKESVLSLNEDEDEDDVSIDDDSKSILSSSSEGTHEEIQDGEDASDKTEQKKKKKKRMEMFFSPIESHAKHHVHFVASELADFFYVNVLESSNDDNNRIDGENGDGVMRDTKMVTSDPRIKKSTKAWNAARDRYVRSFLSVQSMLLQEYKGSSNEEIDDDSSSLSSPSEYNTSSSLSDGDGEIVDLEQQEEGEDDIGETEEAILETMQEVSQAPISGDDATNKPKLNSKQTKPRQYVVFEALTVGDGATNSTEANGENSAGQLDAATTAETPISNFPSVAPADRLVVIDNLPIDISRSRLIEAYSRCGEIEAIEVFHQREDLDPGRRSMDARKKIRKPSGSRQRWRRPRTPLYALILFRDEEGAAKAVVDPLRIFGMVLDKHLIRSFPASDMTELYLEDVTVSSGSAGPSSPSFASLPQSNVSAIENELSQVLHPELYVSVDVSRRRLRPAKNVKIKFPNFEAAYWSYVKLSTELPSLKDGNSSLHWMETPGDAVLYWTRQLNF